MFAAIAAAVTSPSRPGGDVVPTDTVLIVIAVAAVLALLFWALNRVL